jgi:hypothetical protein
VVIFKEDKLGRKGRQKSVSQKHLRSVVELHIFLPLSFLNALLCLGKCTKGFSTGKRKSEFYFFQFLEI